MKRRKYDYSRPVRSAEQMCIDALRFQILQACHWNRTRAAWHLGISVRGLRLWIKDLERFGCVFPAWEMGSPNPDDHKISMIFGSYQTSDLGGIF